MTDEERVPFQEEVTRYVGRTARLVLGSPHEGQYGTVTDLRTTRQPAPAPRFRLRQREQHVSDGVGALVLGESLLVLHKASLAEESAWVVSRIGFDGRVLWEADTGIADPTRLLATDRVFVVGGYRDFQEPTRHRPYHLACFDLETGAVQAIRVSDL